MTRLDHQTCRARLEVASVGRLATVTADGLPHVVPCCFALVGDRIYSAVDGKPKSTMALRRLDNIRANPAASLVVDHYADDWNQLWWVRADGRCSIVAAAAELRASLDALADKYRQYQLDPPQGPVLGIDVERLTGWSFAPQASH